MKYLLFGIHVLLAGCGGGDGDAKDASNVDGPPRDAAIDAPPDAPTAVRHVECPANPDVTVTTSSFKWTPESIAITVGDVVRFAPEPFHRAVPHASKPTDPGLNSGTTGEVRCLQFTEAGVFNYQCAPHPTMEGVVTVTN